MFVKTKQGKGRWVGEVSWGEETKEWKLKGVEEHERKGKNRVVAGLSSVLLKTRRNLKSSSARKGK